MTTIDKKGFRALFKDQTIPLSELRPGGNSRKIAEEANESVGRKDAAIHTGKELDKIFDIIDKRVDADGVDGKITLKDATGQLTDTGKLVERFQAAARGKKDLFKTEMFMVHITGWPADKLRTNDELDAPRGATFALYETDPKSNLHIPPPSADGVLFATQDFSVRNSGNFTLNAPKGSYKVALGDDVVGMDRLNLKAMYNDPSQMREAIAWDLFAEAGVHAPRHTFAKVAINDNYRGLYSVIENVDEEFLSSRFGDNDKGNLYKAYWNDKDVGPADLSHRKDADGQDDGDAYKKQTDIDARSYQLKTNDDDDKKNNYDDLATLVRAVNGKTAGGTVDFNSPEYAKAVEDVMDVKGFLRWASTNVLLGAWDNYWATPANYYLYNSGKKGDEDGFMEKPYFHFVPWDYDNSLGIDYFKTDWQYADILDWGKSTKGYNKGDKETNLPLVENLLKNDKFKQYYLDHLEHMLDTSFNPEAMAKKIGKEGDGGLWDTVRQPAYLESDSQYGGSHTGRQFSNHDVYLQGSSQWELNRGDTKIQGIEHYVKMRHDSAKKQLAKLRQKYPKGASGATFNGKPDKIPSA